MAKNPDVNELGLHWTIDLISHRAKLIIQILLQLLEEFDPKNGGRTEGYMPMFHRLCKNNYQGTTQRSIWTDRKIDSFGKNNRIVWG